MEEIMNKTNRIDEHGNLIGYWDAFYPDGQPNWRGNYVKGKRTGYWEGYDEGGEVIKKMFYGRKYE